HVLLALVVDRFVRYRETNGTPQIEVYHDRLREMIVASLSEEKRRQRHLRLAIALEVEPVVDPAAVAIHSHAAGHFDRAAKFAVIAGEQATNALAFERAAQLYQLALECGTRSGDELTAVRKSLAAALAHAGRGAAAADVYLKAAENAEPLQRSE